MRQCVIRMLCVVGFDTCGARHSDINVDMFFVIKFCRHSECSFAVTTVVTEEEPASITT